MAMSHSLIYRVCRGGDQCQTVRPGSGTARIKTRSRVSLQKSHTQFVSGVAERLAPGGAVVLGIDNRAGVRHLARTPESLSQRSFTSTGYSPARTFTRAELAGILSRSGLQRRPARTIFVGRPSAQ